MTTIPVVYKLSVDGAEAAASKIGEVPKRMSSALDSVGSAFTKISRDIDTVAGKNASVFAKMADDVLGVANAFIGGGGLVGAATAVAAIVGGKLLDSWEKEEKAQSMVKDRTRELDSAYRELHRRVEDITAANKRATSEEIGRVVVLARTREAVLQAQRAQQIAAMALMKVGSDERNRMAAQVKETGAAIAQAVLDTDKAVAAQRVAFNRELSREATEAEAAESQARADKIQEEAEKRIAIEKRMNDALNQAREELAREAEKNRQSDASAEQSQWATWEDNTKLVKERADALAKYQNDTLDDYYDRVAKGKVLEEQQNKTLKEYYAGVQKAKRAVQEKEQAERQAALGSLVYAQAQTVVTAAQMVAQPVVSELTSSLRELGNVNRDNLDLYRMEMRELPAIIAAKVQGILAGIAAEAAGRAVMETGNAVAEVAFGIAALATPGLQATAPGHFASAAQHAGAAAIYGTLAGGAGGAAIGVGMTRGSGGLFGLTKEEKEENERRRGGGSSGGSGGGSGSGGGYGRVGGQRGGGTGQAQDNVINIIYQAGSVGGDDMRTAQTVVRGIRVASRSAFMRQVEG